MSRGAALVAASILVAVVAVPAAAQSRDPAADAQQIFTSVMSPYCPGLLLADCPSPAAFELRADIRKRLDAGESPADIERELYHRYGEVIRAVPPAQGWGRVLWIAPAVVLALSLAELMWFLARSRGDEVAGGLQSAPADSSMEERLQQELDEVS